MSKLVIIDNTVEECSNRIHRFSNDVLIQTSNSIENKEEQFNINSLQEKSILVFNVQLNGSKGKELVKQIREKQVQIYVLLSAESDEEANEQEQVLACANWLIHKENYTKSVVDEIKLADNAGKTLEQFVSNRMIKLFKNPRLKSWENTEPLTNCEVEIMELLSKGLLYKEIAKKKSISIQTVKSHLKHIYPKLRVNNRSEAILKYLHTG
ncbi:MAG: response regulator transcription factor [Bacteroidales bacterium]|nr:response regulator transcription factor [Bacteroidales bacterium]